MEEFVIKEKLSIRNATTLIGVIANIFLVIALSGCLSGETVTPSVITDTPVTPGPPMPVTDTPSGPITDTPMPTLTPTPIPDESGSLPDMPKKPVPTSSTFQQCPPQGDGGDKQLNLLKNRIDEGSYVPVKFDSIMNLTWPKTIERKDRSKWSTTDKTTVAKYEGIPVMVEGYLFGARESGSESTNCHATSPDMVDWHIWLTKAAGEERAHSIVIEATPRIRPNHKWTIKLLDALAKNQTMVRISGWLFLDPEHPDQVGQTRGTIWEIHPIMQIEVQQNGNWVPLDNLTQ
jgi:hypothetical protein